MKTECIHTSTSEISAALDQGGGNKLWEIINILNRLEWIMKVKNNGPFKFPDQIAMIGSFPLAIFNMINHLNIFYTSVDIDFLADVVVRPATNITEFSEEQICSTLGLKPWADWEFITSHITSIGILTWQYLKESTKMSMTYCNQNGLPEVHDWVNHLPASFVPFLVFSNKGVYFAFPAGGVEDNKNNYGRIPNPVAYFNQNLSDRQKISRVLIALKYFSFLPDQNNIDLFSKACIDSIFKQTLVNPENIEYFNNYIQKITSSLDKNQITKFYSLLPNHMPMYANRMTIA